MKCHNVCKLSRPSSSGSKQTWVGIYGIKIVTASKCIFEETAKKVSKFWNHNSQDPQHIVAPSVISVVVNHSDNSGSIKGGMREHLLSPPPFRRKKWQKSAIFSKFFDFCPLHLSPQSPPPPPAKKCWCDHWVTKCWSNLSWKCHHLCHW